MQVGLFNIGAIDWNWWWIIILPINIGNWNGSLLCIERQGIKRFPFYDWHWYIDVLYLRSVALKWWGE